jgi:hypothetical protein
MSETEWPSGEESIDEEGRNATQQRIDEEGASDRPADVEENEPSPHQGEEGQELV